MNRGVWRRVIWQGLLAVAGFLLLIGGIDRVLATQQDSQLHAIYRTYQALGGSASQRVTLAKDHHVTITVLTGKATTQRELMLQNLVDRQRTIVGQSTSMRINGQAERLYVGRSKTAFYGIWQRRTTLWSVAPSMAAGLVALYFTAVILLLWGEVHRHRYWEGHVAKMTANLQRLRHERPLEPIILTPGSPFTAMGAEIDRLQTATEHIRGKLAMRQTSFDRLIDHLPQGVMLIDDDRQVVLSNQAMGTLTGRPVDPLPHNYLDDIKTYALAKMIEHTFHNRKTHHKEITLLMTQKAVDANVIALTGDPNREQVLVILYDVTYLRQVEQMQLDFVGNVSHELKTPVTAISGFAETLLAGAKDEPETLNKFLGIIYDESSRLTQLITDILTLSRPENDQPRQTPVDLSAIVVSALHSLAKPIEEKHLRIVNELPSDLVVESDDVKLSQVLRNLLNNAVFYNRQDGRVTVSGYASKDLLTLTVQDTGIGIADADQARVFERFYRVDKARSRHNGGTGLGLAIVAEMVQQLNGEVHIASQLAVGTTFTVTIPLT